MMVYKYYLVVAGLIILLDVDKELVVNEEFYPFLTTVDIPDIHATFRCVNKLPQLSQKPIYADIFCAVSENEKGYLQKFFFDTKDGNYVVSTYSPDNKNIFVEYPESYKESALDLQNCFYWLGFEESLLQKNKLCIHAACVDTRWGGILFSGVAGIGKSTQADLWCKYRGAKQINGDRPILSKEGQDWLAWGTPYAGSSKIHINDNCPVAAIVLLKQSKACAIRKLTSVEAFRGVWSGLTIHSWDPLFVEMASQLAMDLVASVPIYEYCCTPDKTAVECLEQTLRKE